MSLVHPRVASLAPSGQFTSWQSVFPAGSSCDNNNVPANSYCVPAGRRGRRPLRRWMSRAAPCVGVDAHIDPAGSSCDNNHVSANSDQLPLTLSLRGAKRRGNPYSPQDTVAISNNVTANSYRFAQNCSLFSLLPQGERIALKSIPFGHHTSVRTGSQGQIDGS